MTHRELLNRLPSPYNEQAIENCKNWHGEEWLLKSEHNDVAHCLWYGFDWLSSPENEPFWQAVYKRALNGEFDPPQDPSVTFPREDWEVVEKAIEYTLDYILIQDVDRLPFERIREAIQSQLNPKQ